MNIDEKYMFQALKLAEQGKGLTNPNPMVGSVLVKGGKVVGKGYHTRAGYPHAEVVALKEAGIKARGATLYVNLEPCNHFGRTSPCTEAIIQAGVKKVVTAIVDPNPLNSGKGISRLKSAGIELVTGILENEAEKLNEAFLKFIVCKRPFVIIKAASSLDGKIAARSGESKWITGEQSRAYVQQLRREADAVLVGVNTVIKDNPRLTVRNEKFSNKQPLRIIVDSRARIPLSSRVLQSPTGTIVVVTRYADKGKLKVLERKGVKVLVVGSKDKKVNLLKLMEKLGTLEIVNLLVEGGGEINASFLASRLADKVIFFLAPRIIGGREAITSVEGEGAYRIARAVNLRDLAVRRFEDDVMVEGYPCY